MLSLENTIREERTGVVVSVNNLTKVFNGKIIRLPFWKPKYGLNEGLSKLR